MHFVRTATHVTVLACVRMIALTTGCIPNRSLLLLLLLLVVIVRLHR